MSHLHYRYLDNLFRFFLQIIIKALSYSFLQKNDWSDTFCDFVDLCLKKNPAERPSSTKLLADPYVTRLRSDTVLLELIARTKAAVRELDNLNYRKMKKILMVDTCETESAIGDTDDTQDEHAGGDSSKSNSITSEHSIQSVGVSAASSQVVHNHQFLFKPKFKYFNNFIIFPVFFCLS